MHRVYNNRGVWCDVDPARPDLRQFPAYRDANALEVVLQPGEALFLPMGWWHQVLALDVSVMLTLDSFAVPGGLTYWAVR
jgi:ribosomal protein L16 Arg81 hydroxylase